MGWEDPLEKGKATQPSILAWRIPWTLVHGVAKSWTQLSDFHFLSFPFSFRVKTVDIADFKLMSMNMEPGSMCCNTPSYLLHIDSISISNLKNINTGKM